MLSINNVTHLFHYSEQAMMPATTAGLPAEINTLPKLLRVAGYKAHMVGKWHLGNSRWCQTPVGRGFNSFTGAMLSHIDSYTKEMFSPNGIPIAIDWVRSFENKSLFYEQDLRHATIAITSEAENIIRKHEESSPLFLYVVSDLISWQIGVRWIVFWKRSCNLNLYIPQI
jgi:arylsulfatase A-like enzyme